MTHRPQRLLALLAAFALLRSPFRGGQYRFVGAVALVCSAARAGNGIVTANGSLAFVIDHGEAVGALPVGGSPVEAHAHSHPAKDEVMHPCRVEPSFHQVAAEADQFADGIAAVDGMHHRVWYGVEDLTSPLVHQVWWRNDKDRFTRVFMLHQRRNADAHQGFAAYGTKKELF